MNAVIKLEKFECMGKKIVYTFDSTLKVFKRKDFFIEYDREIDADDPGMAMIPFLAAMVPICWASGADLELPCAEAAYLESLESVKAYFKKWFPRWEFNFQMRLTDPGSPSAPVQDPPTLCGMLFSGGLDSLTTLIHHKEENPVLFTIFGADIPLKQTHFIQLCKSTIDNLSLAHNLDVRYINTNVREIFDEKKLEAYCDHWYGEVAHGILLSALLAPLSHRFLKTLYIASCSHPESGNYACGSNSQILQNIRWGGMAASVDNRGMSRSEKVAAYLKDREDWCRYLRVCWLQFNALNCGRCEKCLRTICDLLVNNVDPALCNFKINRNTLPALKKKMLTGYYFFLNDEGTLDFWKAIQRSIDLDSIEDMYGSREFFTWMSEFGRLKARQNKVLGALAAAWQDLHNALARAKLTLLG